MERRILFVGNTYLSKYVREYLFYIPYNLGLIKSFFSKAGIRTEIMDFGHRLQQVLSSYSSESQIHSDLDSISLDLKSNINLIRLLDSIFTDIPKGMYTDIILSYQSNIDLKNSIAEPIYLAKYLSLKYPNVNIILGGPGILNIYSIDRDLVKSFNFCKIQNNISLNELILSLGIESQFIDSEVGDIFTADSKDITKFLYKDIPDFENRTCLESVDINCSIFRLTPNFDDLDISAYEYNSDDIINFKLRVINNQLASNLKSVISPRSISIMPLMFILGCVNSCAYCDNGVQKLSFLPVSRVIEIIKELHSKYNITNYMFLNSEINLSPHYLDSLLDEILELDFSISWSDCAMLRNLNRRTLFKLSEAGCKRLCFGLESASTNLLKKFNKYGNMDEIRQILKDSRDAGILNHVCLITGFPYETIDDIEKTKSFIKSHLNLFDHFTLNAFSYNPFTDIYLNPVKYDLIRADTPKNSFERGFDEIHGVSWTDKKEISAKHYDIITKFIVELFLIDKRLVLSSIVDSHYMILTSEIVHNSSLVSSILDIDGEIDL